MSLDRTTGPSALYENKLKRLSGVFKRLWPLDEAAPFGRMLRAIDEALVQHRYRARIARLHRMLERNYSS